MFEHLRIVPVSRIAAIGVRWFFVGATTGVVLTLILQQVVELAELRAPRPPVVTDIGGEAAVVRFQAKRDGQLVSCTLTMHWRTKAWTLTC
jgi:hypothetical protein